MKSKLTLLALTATLLCSSIATQAQDTRKSKKFGPTGIVSVPYAFNNAPKDGYQSMTFTIRIDEAPNRSRSFYYAMQFKFIDGNGGYIGLQPRGGDTGMAVFSAFGKGAVPVSDNCRGGADGGKGVSCSKKFKIDYKTDYYLEIERDHKDQTLWRGYIKNVKTSEKIEIGAWKPRSGAKGLTASNVGFVEYFPLIHDCTDISNTTGFFGHPSAKTMDGKNVSGKIGKLSTYGRCKSINFASEQTNEGSSIALTPK